VNEISATVLRAEVESRLRPVCPDWPEELFQAVVSRIVEITLKFDQRGQHDLVVDPRITEQLVNEMRQLVERSAEVRSELKEQSPPATE
jgi:hypothetical protein